MQSTNIYKVKPILCFGQEMCELAANGKDREWVGWQQACAMQTNMVPLNFFSIVAPLLQIARKGEDLSSLPGERYELPHGGPGRSPGRNRTSEIL